MSDRSPIAATSPLGVLHMCTPASVGGLERVVQGLSVGLASRGHRVGVAAVVDPRTNTSALFAPLLTAGVTTFRIPTPRRGYLQERRHVDRLLDQFQPDVLHTHGYRADLLHGWRARQLGVATVTTVHGKSRMGRVSNLLEWVHERSLNRSDAVVSVSAPLADSLRRVGVSPDRIHAVPNALVQTDPPLLPAEARRLLGLPRSGFVIGWVGRLVSVKGCDVFIRALSHMADLDWTAVVIGDGPERTHVERLAQQLDIGSKVRFLGEVSDAGRCFSAFDLFVLSSRSEGTPMTLLEAMAAECPVVAAAVGGVPDVMRDPHEGWLVPPDDPTALAEAIQGALQQPIVRRARAARALQRTATDYSPDTWIRRHEHVYRTAIAVRGGAQARNRSSIR